MARKLTQAEELEKHLRWLARAYPSMAEDVERLADLDPPSAFGHRPIPDTPEAKIARAQLRYVSDPNRAREEIDDE